MKELLDLPDEVLLLIFGLVDYDDLRRLQDVNRRCSRLAKVDTLWENHCRKHWLLDTKTRDSWIESFNETFEEFGRYIDSYSTIIEAWHKIKKFLQDRVPAIIYSLEDGLTEIELDDLEAHYDCKLPIALRLLYRICGGQNTKFHFPGLFGSLASIYTHSLNTYYFINPTLYEDTPSEGIRSSAFEKFKKETLTLAMDDHANQFCLVLSRQNEDVHASDGGPPAFSIVWISQGHIYEVAPSFEDWFLDHVKKTTSGCYDIDQGELLRYNYEPECVARTGSIEVRAGSVLSEHWQDGLLYEYRITMSMDKDADVRDSCQLMVRHWIINQFDSDEEKKVSGPGVVGEYPIMKPGTKYSWMSRTNIAPPGGSMKGHFTMRNLATSSQIEIECPKYSMRFPHEYTKV